MYEVKVLGLTEAQIGVQAVVEEVRKDGSLPVTVAVADPEGNLITLTRMDGARSYTVGKATEKAYTAAIMRRDTRTFLQGRLKAEYGSREPIPPGMTVVPGGNAITEPGGAVVGAIGVSGRPSPEEDEHLAIIGLKAIQNYLQSSKEGKAAP